MALLPEGGGGGGQQQRGPREAARLGLPDGFKVYSPFPFGGMNQQDARIAIQNNEWYWRENYIKVGNGYLRTMGDVGTPIYTAPLNRTIISFFFFSQGVHPDCCAIFLDDGTAFQLGVGDGSLTPISLVPGTFWQAGAPLPACVQWGSQYLLIANNFAENGYWIWDGVLLYSAGSLSPNVTITNGGSGYTSVPTVTAYGGSGTGAAFTASIAAGSVTNVAITNAGSGYVAGDQVQLGFTGGGSDTTVILQAVMAPGAAVANVTITASGTGFTDGTYALVFAGGGGGVGAAGTYTCAGGIVLSIAITNGGSGYTSTPTVTFPSGGGLGATGTVILLGGDVVASIVIVNGGSGVTGTPLITFLGGGGTGATATATVAAGAVSSVTVTRGGSGYSSAPLVQVSVTANNAAQAVVDIMPTGVSGSIIETFQSRVWLAIPYQSGSVYNGGTLLVSAPNSFVDFATSDGGLLFVSSDPFLRTNYIALKQTNGYLYPFGDSSVSIISNVQTSGTSASTTFNYQNTDPQVGAGWRDTVQAFGRSLVFFNHDGIYGLYGGAVTKLSDKLNRLIEDAVLPTDSNNQPVAGALVPSSALCLLHETKLYLLLVDITDPFTQATRRVMLCWDGQEWSVASQSKTLTFIASQEVASNILAFGTDGTTLCQLFATPSATLVKTLATKLYGAEDLFITKMAYSFYVAASDYSSPATGITLAVTVDNEDASYPLPQAPALDAPAPQMPVYGARSGDIPGQMLGCTVASTSPDFVIGQIVLGFYDQAALA